MNRKRVFDLGLAKRKYFVMTSKAPQCCRCGHLAIRGSEESFMETPCSHLYCGKCVHRYVSRNPILQYSSRLYGSLSRIRCSACDRIIYRHELNASSDSKEDQFFQVRLVNSMTPNDSRSLQIHVNECVPS
jgi:hypothetical protein